MLTLHHLRIGRSIFTVWLLEELGLDYELKVYLRDKTTMRAPPELKAIHPLGKSPVIEDGAIVLAESGAIAAYLLDTYGAGKGLAPARSDKAAHARFLHWLHYPEGSAFLPLFITMIQRRFGAAPGAIDAFAAAEVTLHLDYMTRGLGSHPFILGQSFSAADIGLAYVASLARRLQLTAPYPMLDAYVTRMTSRPAYQRALARAVE